MFDALLGDARRSRKRLTIYSPDVEDSLAEQFERRGVAAETRSLPPEGPEPFATIHEAETFVGSLRLTDLAGLLALPIPDPGAWEDTSAGYRALFELFENTVFRALDRRQLLWASREIEDRAFRVDRGVLRVSFQSLSAFASQVEVYRRLAEETDLEIHIYGEADWTPPAIDGVTYHGDGDDILGRFWIVAFDGGGDELQACALVARQERDGFAGVWTYNPAVVANVLAELEAAGR